MSIRTDNGPQFVSKEFKQFLVRNGIQDQRTTPLWPQANGKVERQNRSILKRIKIAQAEGLDWKNDLRNFLMMYRSTPHSTTGISPAELLYGRKMRTKLPEIAETNVDDTEIRDRDSDNKEKGKMYSDLHRHVQERGIKPGTQVLVQRDKVDKFTTTFNPKPLIVVEKHGNQVTVEKDDGVHYKRNVSRVKLFYSPDLDTESIDVEPGRPARKTCLPLKMKDYVMS